MQLRFFDRYLRGQDVPPPHRIRLEIRESRDVVAEVREEDSWPLKRTRWQPLYLAAAGLATTPQPIAGRISFGTRTGGVHWEWTTAADTEITGPMLLRLWVEAHDTDDVDLYAGVEHISADVGTTARYRRMHHGHLQPERSSPDCPGLGPRGR